MLTVECAVFDFATIVIEDQITTRSSAKRTSTVGKRPARLARPGSQQVGWPAIKRNCEFPGGEPRTIDNRLIIAGEKTGGITELTNAYRHKVGFKELPCYLAP